jgi:outer membrane protein assembly factor BamB
MLLAAAGISRGEIIIVDDDGPADFNTIQAAINNSAHGDTIYVFPGRYTGPGNRNIDFVGRAITVRSIAPEDPYFVAATVVDCQGMTGFYFRSGEGPHSALEGLTITNGWRAVYCAASPTIAYCNFTGNNGAISIYYHTDCPNPSPTIAFCSLTGNNGAIYCGSRSSSTIANCDIIGNGTDKGGGIYCESLSNPTIIDCNISYNIASISGGGLYLRDGKVLGCTINGNVAANAGGGLYLTSGTVSGCTINGNTAGTEGGGVYGLPDQEGIPLPRVCNCSITGNTAWDGGGLAYCFDVASCVISGNTAIEDGGGLASCHRIRDCLISGNLAGRDGGGIYCRLFPGEISTSTICGNTTISGFGGGVLCSDYFGACADTQIDSSIVWGNRDSGARVDLAQVDGYPMVTFSCIQDDDPNDWYVPFGGQDAGNIDDDPMLVREPNDGGDGWGDDPCTPDVNEAANDDFGDLHLQPESPCVDTGDPCFAWWQSYGDIDGDPRVMGGRVEMGADEFLIPWITVTKPQTGDVWAATSTHQIYWDSYGVTGTVDILFSSDNGGAWSPIDVNVVDTGSLLWQLPGGVDSNQCLVSVVPSAPDPNVILTDSGLFTIHPAPTGPDVPARWRSLGGDFDRSGLSGTYGPELGCLKWQFETDGEVAGSVTVGKDDRVHIACEGGKLYTLDVNGLLLWSCDTNSPLLSSPTIGPDGTVYVGSENGKLFAIDIDGNLRWTHTVNAFIYSSPAVSADGNTVFVGSGDGILHALGRDGSKLWSFETTGFGTSQSAIFASPAVGTDGTVYIGALYDPNLYALDPNDGTVKWVCRFESWPPPWYLHRGPEFGWPFASPVVAPDGTIYQRQFSEPNLYAINPNTGSIIWSLDIPRPECHGAYAVACFEYQDVGDWAEPALGPDGTVYAVFTGPCGPTLEPYDWVPWRCLEAIDPNGTTKWTTALGANGDYTLTVGSNGMVYAAGSDGYLLVVDANGRVLARYQNDTWTFLPVISSDGTLIVLDGNDRVLAIKSGNCRDQILVLHRLEDLDGSGVVNFGDFAVLALDWLSCTSRNRAWWEPYCDYAGEEMHLAADVDRNLYVDWRDLRALGERWLRAD